MRGEEKDEGRAGEGGWGAWKVLFFFARGGGISLLQDETSKAKNLPTLFF
jgi:hypothetical protein